MDRITKNSKRLKMSEINGILKQTTENAVKAVFLYIENETEVKDKDGNIVENAKIDLKKDGKTLDQYILLVNSRRNEKG